MCPRWRDGPVATPRFAGAPGAIIMGVMTQVITDDAAPLFDAVLSPHRSLSTRGFAGLMVALAGAVLLVGIFFTTLGARPVLPFFGGEVLLIWLAFHLNFRSARAYETLRLTPAALTVEQVKPSGQCNATNFQPPHWLRVKLTPQPGDNNELALTSHGRSLVVGRFLSPEEPGRLPWNCAPRLAGWRRIRAHRNTLRRD